MKMLESALEFNETEASNCATWEGLLESADKNHAEQESLDFPISVDVTTLAKRYIYWEAEREAAKARFAAILEARESDLRLIENKLNWYERQILSALPPAKDAEVVNDAIAVTYRESTRCEIVDSSAVPLEYSKTTIEPDIALIKTALKDNVLIPGARLSKNYSLQVKPGGPSAIAASKRRAKEREKQNEV